MPSLLRPPLTCICITCICGRQNTEYRIQNPGGPHPRRPSDSPVSRIQNPTSTHVPPLLPCICITCTCRGQNTEYRIQNPGGPATLDAQASRIQNTESGRPTPVDRPSDSPVSRIQNPESRGPRALRTHTQPPTDSRIQHPESGGGRRALDPAEGAESSWKLSQGLGEG